MNRAPTPRYDAISQAFHWSTAIVVTVAFILGPGGFGRLMRQGVDPATLGGIVWHETLGMLVLALTLLRLLWAAVRPARPATRHPPWLSRVARLTHVALWGLLLALPASALLALAGGPHPLTLLGGLRVERIPFFAGSAIARLADWGDVHEFLGDLIMWLAGLHAAAAIFHEVVLRDGALSAMLPVREGGPP